MRIYYLLHDFSLNSVSISGIHYLFREFILNPIFSTQSLIDSPFYSRFKSEFTILCPKIIIDTLFFSRNQFGFAICFAAWLWIHYLILEITFNSLSASRFSYELATFCSNPPSIHYLLHDSPWIHYVFLDLTFNSLCFSRFDFQFTICLAISLWIHYLIREYTLNPQSFWPNHYGFGDSLWIHCLLRDFTMNSLSLSRIHLELTILFTKSLGFHHICFAISRHRRRFHVIVANITS